jgi:hypothetical protein
MSNAAAPGGAPPRRLNYLNINNTGNLPNEAPIGGRVTPCEAGRGKNRNGHRIQTSISEIIIRPCFKKM